LAELPTPKPQQLEIQQLFSDSVLVLSSLIEQKGITISYQVLPKKLRYELDKKQLEQVLINLLTNSIYALEQTQKPQITLKAFESQTELIIEVTDNGTGISDQIKREIFVPFFTTRENGSGIGLSLSKNIVQAHQGTLTFSSIPGETTFKMRFPLARVM
jgi:signal transduction histidine kinase